MSSIDDRVVNMQFNNGQFQQGVADTNKSLSDLKDSLKLDGATSGIDQVSAASNRFSLQGMESAVSNISSHFSILGAVGFTVINDITNGALNAGRKIAGALIDPLVQGGANRALALQQAQFQFKGLGLNVKETMDVALAAVKGTAFGLDDAATAAAQFGASGITASTGLAQVLRGVAGVAAQTGSSYSSVAQIFESVAGNGRLMGQDLLQLSSRGVNAAAVLAKSMGKTEAQVRDMVSKGKISFKEFSDAMNNAFGANAANANQTFTGALANMHAALARIGADVASPYFLGMRDIFNALGPLFDTIHTAIKPFLTDLGKLQASSAAGIVKGINEVNNGIAKFMGSGFGQALQILLASAEKIGGAFKDAFGQIFPPETGTQLTAIADAVKQFATYLEPLPHEVEDFKRIFAGFFAIVDIGIQLVSSLGKEVFKLLGLVVSGSGGFLDFAAKIGDWLVNLDEAIKKGDVFTEFFKTLAGIIATPIAILKTFFGIVHDGVVDLGQLSSKGVVDFANDVSTRFSGLIALGQFFGTFWADTVKVAQAVWGFLKPIFIGIGDGITWAVNAVKDSLKGLTFDDALKAINTGIFGGFLVVLNGFFGNVQNTLKGNGFAITAPIKATLTSLRTNLKALEMSTNAKTLKEIAISVALLAASAVALSLVDSGKLAGALIAIAGLIKGLLVAFEAFSKLTGTKGVAEIIGISVALNGIATAVLTLAGAVAILSLLPWPNLVQGLAAVMILILGLTKAMKDLAKSGPELLFAAGAMVLMGDALLLISGAVAILGALPIQNMIQGMVGISFILGILIQTISLLAKDQEGTLLAAASMLLMAGAISVLAGVVALLGALPMKNLGQGLIAFAAIIAILVGAVLLLGTLKEDMLLSGIALAIIANSIGMMVAAVAILGKIPMGQLITGMVALAAMLAIVVGAVLLLGVSSEMVLLGAAALIVTAAAIALLAPAVALLGKMSWDDIGRGLTMLSASILILAAGGILLIPASVGFLLFGLAILAIGAGVEMAATGIALLAVSVAALLVVAGGGVALIGAALNAFIAKLPAFGAGIGAALVSMATVIGDDAPKLVNAFVKILLAMLAGIDKVVPQIIKVATDIIVALVNALVVLIPLVVTAGLKIINGVLKGIGSNIGGIVTNAVTIIVNFVNAIGNNLYRIIAAAGGLVLKFINGISDYITNNGGKFQAAGTKLFKAIVDGVSDAIINGGYLLSWAGEKIGNAIIQGTMAALHINSPSKVFRDDIMGAVFEGVEAGNDKHISRASDAGTAIGSAITKGAMSSIKDSVAGISDAIAMNTDTTPTIRPVIDLTNIKSGAKQINGLFAKSPSLSLNTSTDVATSVSLQEQTKNAQLVLDASNTGPQASKALTFIQNNNSPLALTTAEIYRQTSNQLSILKGDLGVVDQTRSP